MGCSTIKDLGEKFLVSERKYVGKIINLRIDTVVLPDGNLGLREVVEYAGAVAIVPLNDNELYLVKQYRYAVKEVLLEIPAGKIEPGEGLLDSAKRELLEETGLEAKKIIKMMDFYTTPGFTTEKVHLFMATELVVKKQDLDKDEFINVVKVPFEEALDMISSGKICDAKTVAGILAVKFMINNNKILR